MDNFKIIISSISFGAVIGYVFRLFIEHQLSKRREAENRNAIKFNEAASKFRSTIIRELEGLYPATQYWDRNIFSRFRESITKVESAVAEFSHFLPNTSKGSLAKALKNYSDHCNSMTWESCAAFNMYPSMRKPGEKGPREVFQLNIDALLSFAKDI